uniref:glutamate decarboxylase n=1 Tax=Mucochytrium quahogii TaxID=96639 RepID=A0A7S2R830_9STRA
MCLYFDIEVREAEVSQDNLCLTAERAKVLIDERTIGVCPILGSTYNGEYEDVKGIHDMVQKLNKENGWDVPIHVDAASGGFVAPFTTPELLWDFRLPGVKSINASGHKFGLVYAGVGWLCFRDEASLPDEIVTHLDYLGGHQTSFTLNFSRPASQILAQYFMFLRLGFEGYTKVMNEALYSAQYLRQLLGALDAFEIVDKAHLPVVAFKLKTTKHYTLYDLQNELAGKGWQLPAYKCPPGADQVVIMRAVIRKDFTRQMVLNLFRDIAHAHDSLINNNCKAFSMDKLAAEIPPVGVSHENSGILQV